MKKGLQGNNTLVGSFPNFFLTVPLLPSKAGSVGLHCQFFGGLSKQAVTFFPLLSEMEFGGQLGHFLASWTQLFEP